MEMYFWGVLNDFRIEKNYQLEILNDRFSRYRNLKLRACC
jgi:hypothetical protein